MSRMTPGDVPSGRKPTVAVVNEEAETDYDAALVAEMVSKLEKLREPFPPELIEHLPKQKWKASWKDQPYTNCDECHGYHPVGNRTIHLDYVGHAGVTRRLLEVDPMWEWEPLSWTDDGLPRFDGFGGLWIKLTICGVTRLGYGDAAGKDAGTTAVKEIIGDAIRNAAMRFGVALELWSKVDRHAGENPGAIDEAPQRQTSRGRDGSKGGGSDRGRGNQGVGDEAPQPRAANQDALDELLRVCNTHGYDTREVEARYNRTLGPPELVKADPDDIRNYAAILIGEAEAGPPADDQPADDAGAGVGEVAPAEPDAAVADEAQADPRDTSDVEKQPGEMF